MKSDLLSEILLAMALVVSCLLFGCAGWNMARRFSASRTQPLIVTNTVTITNIAENIVVVERSMMSKELCLLIAECGWRACNAGWPLEYATNYFHTNTIRQMKL